MTPEQAVARLVGACPSFVESDMATGVYERLAELAHHLVPRIGDGQSTDPYSVLLTVEDLLQTEDQVARQIATVGLLEDLQNIATFPDTTITPEAIEGLLGNGGMMAWRELEALWLAVNEELLTDDTPRTMDASTYRRVSNVGLRRLIQITYRSMPDGTMVGLADVLRYEARRGGGPHMAKV
jgi:hypothetical protein